MTAIASAYIKEWYPDDDEHDFAVRVRVRSIWDEAHFTRMMSTAQAFLDEMAATARMEENWRHAFTDELETLIHLVRHPGFLAENDLGLSAYNYKAFIEERVRRLQELRARYEALEAHFGHGLP